MSVLGTTVLRQRVHTKTELCPPGCIQTHIIVDPFDTKSIRTNSIDITLGRYLKVSNGTPYGVPYNYKKGNVEYEIIDLYRGPFILRSKHFVLGMVYEYIRIPLDLTANVETRSSIGRFGLFSQNAGRIESGWGGNLTLELFNAEDFDIFLEEGMPIAQVVFETVEGSVVPYYGFNDSKYQGDTKPEPSKLWMNK